MSKFLFLRNIYSGQNLNKLYNAFISTRSRLGLLPIIFRKFVTELLSLIYVNLVLAQNLQSKWIEFHQILYMSRDM